MRDKDGYFEVCQELGAIITSGKSLWEPAFWIQFFCEYIEQGETPRMALALVKKELQKEQSVVK